MQHWWVTDDIPDDFTDNVTDFSTDAFIDNFTHDSTDDVVDDHDHNRTMTLLMSSTMISKIIYPVNDFEWFAWLQFSGHRTSNPTDALNLHI